MKINPESNIQSQAASGEMTNPITSFRVTSLARSHLPVLEGNDTLKTRADNQIPLKTTEKTHNTARNLRLFPNQT